MKKILLHCTLAILLSSCASLYMKNITKQLPPLEDDAEVTVYELGDTVPEHSEVLGGICFSNNSDWDSMLEIAKKEARAAGGNGLEIQMKYHYTISAFILNINDSIAPTLPAKLEKMDFNDYIVTKGGDTIHGAIVNEKTDYITLVHGYNRQGYRKTTSSFKSQLLSYHIEDPVTLAKQQRKWTRLYDCMFAVDMNASQLFKYINGGEKTIACSSDVRFLLKTATTLGTHYRYYYKDDRFWNGITQTHFIGGSIGVTIPYVIKLDYYLDGGFDLKPTQIKHWVSANFMFGVFLYKVEIEKGNPDYYCNVLGHSWGIGGNLGYDYLLTDHFSIGATVGFIIGNEFYTEVNSDHYHYGVAITPIYCDFSAGLRYYL